MPEDTHQPERPEEWLRYAASDLGLARIAPPPGVMLETLSYHAQQAAEKAPKAVLVSRGVHIPKTHNIRALLDLLPADIAPPVEVWTAARLSDYAVSSRYPVRVEPVTEEEHKTALALAEATVAWAQAAVAAEAADPGDA